MSEESKREQSQTPEILADQLWEECQALMAEEDRIMNEIDRLMGEIDQTFATVPNRLEAEKIVLEKWVPLVDEGYKKLRETSQKSQEVWRAWEEASRRSLETNT